jgi:predicted secreted hydrolase
MNAIPPPSSPDPIQPIHFPQDHYLHPSAPTEWWWHTGTLKAGERIFGFEINAAAFGTTLFTQVMLTDVQDELHYARTRTYSFSTNWAESDTSKDWYVRVPAPGTNPQTDDYVTMTAPKGDPGQGMVVRALMHDEKTHQAIAFDLTLTQQGSPFLVWGTGIQPGVPGGLQTNNFYYSLTRLQASGSISIGGISYEVEGMTWMDHEYGFFGTSQNPVNWILQDLQLDNGVTISNYAVIAATQPPFLLNEPYASQATVQFADGSTYFVRSFVTPRGTTWVSPDSHKQYFLELQVDIPTFYASITVTSLLASQEILSEIDTFLGPIVIAEVYEGVATAAGHFLNSPVQGTAWNEQKPA